MKETTYLFLRKFFFLLTIFVFAFLAPIIVFNSLGYKFDRNAGKFLKTGAVSVRTSPWGASIFLDDVKLDETTPSVLREILPREYSIRLEKTGFYPYQIFVDAKPATVSEVDVVLLPRKKNVEKLKFNFNIYRFFVNKYFFGERIVVFTDQGIYFLDPDFKNIKKISSEIFDPDVVASLEGLNEWNDRLIFWNKNNIWMARVPVPEEEDQNPVTAIYKSEKEIKQVFFGFKDRYLIIHDGLTIVAVDIENPKAFFPVYRLDSAKSQIFYDTRSQTLLIRDTIPATNNSPFFKNDFSLFKIQLLPIIAEEKTGREPEKMP